MGERLHHGPNDAADTLNLYDVSGLAHFELDRAMTAAGDPAGLARPTPALRGDMKKALDGALAQGATDPFGFGFPWDVWDTTTHGAGLSVMASEYDQLTGTSTVRGAGRPLAGQRPRRERLGPVADRRRRLELPQVHPAPAREHRGLARRSAPVLAGAAVEGPNGGATTGPLRGMGACPANGVDAYASSTTRRGDGTTSSPTRTPSRRST